VERLCFWDITNILEAYLEYKYDDIPTLYYKYDEESNESIHGLTKDQHIVDMIKELSSGRRKKLHIFVDHIIVEPVPLEVVQPMLLLSQSPSEVEINDYDSRVAHTQGGVEDEVPQEQPVDDEAPTADSTNLHSSLHSSLHSNLKSIITMSSIWG
jgi:hypothetical protein